MTYTDRGELQMIQDQVGQRTTYGWDGNGNRVTRRFPNNEVTSYIYDGLDRNSGIQYVDGTWVTMSYSAVSNRISMTDSTGQTLYSFDGLSRMTGKTDPGALRQTYVWDAASQRTNLIDPDGGTRTYVFDDDGNQTLGIEPTGKRTTYQFDEASRITTVTDSSALVEKHQYDAVSQLTTLIYLNGSSPVATLVDGYDALGNRATRNEDGSLTTWVYDAANRLTNQQLASAFTTYTMDATGNVTVKAEQGSSPMTFIFNAADQITTYVQSTNLTTVTYDQKGNQTLELTGAARTTYVFDPDNRLTGVQDSGGGRSTYTFDGDGLRRTAHESGGTLTTMIWDGTDYLGEI